MISWGFNCKAWRVLLSSYSCTPYKFLHRGRAWKRAHLTLLMDDYGSYVLFPGSGPEDQDNTTRPFSTYNHAAPIRKTYEVIYQHFHHNRNVWQNSKSIWMLIFDIRHWPTNRELQTWRTSNETVLDQNLPTKCDLMPPNFGIPFRIYIYIFFFKKHCACAVVDNNNILIYCNNIWSFYLL